MGGGEDIIERTNSSRDIILKYNKSNLIMFIVVLVGLVLIFSFGMGNVAAAGNTIYVNGSSGNDSWSGLNSTWINGTLNGPKATIKSATNTVTSGGTINIANGIYTGVNNTNITINKNMNILGQSEEGTIINGTNSNSIFNIPSGITVSIINITLSNGNSANGGAIYNDGILTINNTILMGNTATQSGGAINNQYAMIVNNSIFTNNTAFFGGAIYNHGGAPYTPMTINGSTFTNNYASDGGSIFNDIGSGGLLNITNTNFLGNNATQSGGAVYTLYALAINNSTFTNNTATQNFGGAIFDNCNYLTVPVIITNTTFTNNTATGGGALYTNINTLTITGSNFINNYASTNGGGAISNLDSILNITNTTFTNNTATTTGAGGAINNQFAMIVNNSIFTNNTALFGGAIYNYNTESPSIPMTINGSTFTNNYAPIGGSIYNGYSDGILNITNTNFIGNNATQSGGAIYTLYALSMTNNTFTNNTSTQNFGGAIFDNCNSLTIPVTITNTTFTNNTATEGGALYTNINTLTITGSNFTGNSATNGGGAIYNLESVLNITNTAFTNNIATTTGTGGAINNQYALLLNNTIFIGNIALNGGAIYNYVNASYIPVTISNSTFTNNTASKGGAIYNMGTAILNINFNSITYNTATIGGGIYSGSSYVNANNNWWGSNTSPVGQIGGSGVIYNSWIVLTVTSNPTTINDGNSSTITADLTHDQNGVYYNPTLGHIPDGIFVSFNGTLGSLNPINSTTVNGDASSIFTANTLGVAIINATIGNYSNSTNITILGSVDMYVMQYPWYYDTVTGYENTYSYNTYPIFVVDVENWGNDDATGVIVNYTLGSGFQYITSNTGGIGTATYNPTTRTITWNVGNVPTTGTALMMVDTQAITTGNQTPALTNTATLTNVDQYDTPNNYKTANYSINVPNNADIQVNQTQTTSTQGSNKYVTYTITATNNGPNNATGLQITDQLPTGLTWISDNSSGTYNPNTGIWNIGTLNNGNNIILSITAEINGTGTLINTAQTTAEDQQDWNSNNNAQTLDLTITGTYTPNTNMYVLQYPWYYDTALGYVNTYSYNTYPVFVVDVENWGNDDATGVTVNYTLGTGYQYITSNTGGIGTTTYNPTTRTITWNIGNMPTTGTALMMVDTQAITTGNQTPALTNTATLTNVDQYDTPNNYKTTNYSINVPNNADLQVNQTQNTTTQNNNTYVTYTITATNNGPDNATGLQITDLLPTELTWISDTSQGTYNPTTGIWNIGTLNNNTNTTITITAQITGTGTITNTAQITTEDQQDGNYDNNAQTTEIERSV